MKPCSTIIRYDGQLAEIGTHHVSKPQKVYNRADGKSCLMAILRDRKVEINKYCTYSIITNALETGMYHVSKSTYLVMNIAEYMITCNGTEKQTIKGCKSCLISIPANCTLLSEEYFIPKTLTETGDAQTTKQKHTTNL